MSTKFYTFLVACFVATTVFSQASLNAYKYVIVPNKYDFLKEKNQYQLNALTKFLFEKYGFEALMEGSDYPEDLAVNRCLALNSDVLKDSGLFKTKLTVELKDCNGKTVFTSKVGESREKDFKSAFNLALRDAFESVEALEYKYEPNENNVATVAVNTTAKNETASEIAQLKQEIENLKKEKEAKVEKAPEKQVSTEEAESLKQAKQQEIKALVESKFPKENKIPITQTLYAQEIENGFQLVDRTPKVVYKIKKTGRENLFLVEGEDAVIYKSGDNWVYEYNTDEGVKQQELNIKF
jgi:hypothetical protein